MKPSTKIGEIDKKSEGKNKWREARENKWGNNCLFVFIVILYFKAEAPPKGAALFEFIFSCHGPFAAGGPLSQAVLLSQVALL